MDLRDSRRKERRLPVVFVVNLASVEPVGPERHERTYTDNISAHGVRVRSTYIPVAIWQSLLASLQLAF
jgi:hypothetical protein